MKIKITVGAAMLLSLGSALAGGIMFPKEGSSVSSEIVPAAASVAAREVTPEMLAKWKATAATADYSPPMLPI